MAERQPIFEVDINSQEFKLMEELVRQASIDPEKIKQRKIHEKNHKIYLKGLKLLKKYLNKNYCK
jgi:hypothetical protein